MLWETAIYALRSQNAINDNKLYIPLSARSGITIQEVNTMQLLSSKRGFVHHPFTWVLIAFILGAVVMLLIAKKVIPFPWGIC